MRKSIEEYEGNSWKEFDYPTGLTKKVFDLRKKKLEELTPSDLRIAISQNVGRKYVVPLAIKILKKDLLLDADFYPGDLIESVLNISDDFWDDNLDLKENLKDLISDAAAYINDFDGINKELKNKLLTSLSRFQ